MIRVYIDNKQNVVHVDNALFSLIEKVVRKVWEVETTKGRELPQDAEVSVVLVENASIAKFNLQYRGIDQPTDVLSFAMMEEEDFSELEVPVATPLGDIVISVERAQEQAEEYGHSLEREVAFLTAHGMCHLLGYDHQTELDRAKMREVEESVLTRLDLTRD